MARKEKKKYRVFILDDALNMEKFGAEYFAHIQEVYSFFDKDNDGAITSHDVARVIRSLGHNPTEKELKQLLEEFDPEGEGMIEFSTFLQLLEKVKHDGDSPEEIDEAFRVFDPSGTGLMSSSELRNVLTQLGEKLSEEEAEDFLAFADGSSKGEINWKDLVSTLFHG